MIFFDFEVFKYDWLMVAINPFTKTEHVIVNNKKELETLYKQHQNDIWLAYNGTGYDQWILKGILCDFDPKEINDHIIAKKQKGHTFSSLLYKVPLNIYDLQRDPSKSLKTLEGFMGKSIVETSVSFDIDRKLTTEEIKDTIYYCRCDVLNAMEVFLRSKEWFDANLGLIKLFGLPFKDISKTTAQLTAKICGATKLKGDLSPFNFKLVDAVRHIKKYKDVVDWYENPENFDSKKSYDRIVAGIPHRFGWGGAHAGEKENGEGIYILADVTAYYPSIQEKYGFGKEVMLNWNNFLRLHNENLRHKALGKKVERLPYKIGDNAISGQLKATFSPMYCPSANNSVTINGQLMLLLLIEMTEHCTRLVQTNTDGLLFKCRNESDVEELKRCIVKWQELTGMKMDTERFVKVVQKDVNNYIAVSESGKAKRKGGYVKEQSDLDYDLPIINEAVFQKLLNGKPVKSTIMNCADFRKFQKIVKVSSKYAFAMHNGKRLNEKTFRVFASKRDTDGYIGKCKTLGATNEKFANTPDKCFIWNESVIDVPIPTYLDKQWYINLANKRVSDFYE